MNNTHIHREAWLHDVAAALAPRFAELGYPIPDKLRLTCGFPSVRSLATKNQRVGECWAATKSDDQHFEILVSPIIFDSMQAAGVLAHELIHACIGHEHGHKGLFKKVALAIGLEGKMTSTIEGPLFKQLAQPILDAVGPYPHAKLNAMSNGRKKQAARLIKCECGECGYVARVARQWLDERGPPHCPEHGEMTTA